MSRFLKLLFDKQLNGALKAMSLILKQTKALRITRCSRHVNETNVPLKKKHLFRGRGEGKEEGKENERSHVVCGGRRRTCTNQFSLPRIWVLLGLAASAFIS